MCGIVGMVNLQNNINTEKCKTIINKMSNKINKRGPDEEGFFFSEHALLDHKRLIVIDPEGGKQPMSIKHKDNTYTIVYNGQLYNTEELTKDLEEAGFIFETHSDTEVLLKSYIHYGYDVVNKLNGIFSFAIWNEKKQELYFARDHFGIKPYYYYFKNNTFLFASEVKCFFEYPDFTPIINKEGISELFGLRACSYCPEMVFLKIFMNLNLLTLVF